MLMLNAADTALYEQRSTHVIDDAYAFDHCYAIVV